MPTSTTNQAGKRMDLVTPKGADKSSGTLHEKRFSVAQTPKVGGVGIDLSSLAEVDEVEVEKEDTAR
jgi:hypothetical protein